MRCQKTSRNLLLRAPGPFCKAGVIAQHRGAERIDTIKAVECPDTRVMEAR